MAEFDINYFYTNHRVKCKICNDMLGKAAFCSKCVRMTAYRVEAGIEKYKYNDLEFQHVVHTAFCPTCAGEIYVSDICNANVAALTKAYKLARKKGENENV